MTAQQVARCTGASLSTVYRHLHSGRLTGEWDGEHWNILQDDCISWASGLYRSERSLAFRPPLPQRLIEFFGLK